MKKRCLFFIKVDHKFADGSEGPLFMFGKLNKFKKEIKDLKGPTELHGVAHVETDIKGVTTVVFSPSKGKLDGRLPVLTKAMRTAFTPASAGFKIGSPISEEQAQKLADAADLMEDVADEEVASTAEDTAPATEETKKEEATPADNGAKALISEIADALKTKVGAVAANIKAKQATQADAATIEDLVDKYGKLKGIYDSLSGSAQAALAKNYEQLAAQLPTVQKIRTALQSALPAAPSGGPESAAPATEANNDKAFEAIKAELDKIVKEAESAASSVSDSVAASGKDLASAPKAKLASGKDLLAQL